MAKNTKTSSKYKNIISKSELITSGSPAIYQLKPKKEDGIGEVKVLTLGEKHPNQINKTILLVGETGAGKSTLINSLVNHVMGVEWEDNVWFEMTKEQKQSQTRSKTPTVTVYQIFNVGDKTLPFSLTIIDTPGYGSTNGIEKDIIISQQLFDLFRSENGIHEVNAVGLVLPASESRLSDRLSYIFNSVVSLFGKDMERNIVALVTYSNGRRPKNALEALEAMNIKCAKDEKNQPVHFLFDNCQDETRTEDIEDLRHAGKITSKGMSGFMAFLEQTAPQNLTKTVEVINERIRLTACIQNLRERIESTELKHNEIQQTQGALEKYEEEMKNNENYTVEIEESYRDVERIDGGRNLLIFYKGAVCCKVCEENCHFPGCTVAWSPAMCEVMKDGHCTVCTKKCPVSDHVKEDWRFVNRKRKVDKTLEDIKRKYDENKAESDKSMSLLENLQKEMETLEASKIQLVDEAYQHAVNLDKIALNVLSLTTYVDLGFLIEKMENKMETKKVHILKQIRSQIDESFRAGLKYVHGKLTQVFNRVKPDNRGTQV